MIFLQTIEAVVSSHVAVSYDKVCLYAFGMTGLAIYVFVAYQEIILIKNDVFRSRECGIDLIH